MNRRQLLARGGAVATTSYLAFGLGTAVASPSTGTRGGLSTTQLATLTALSAATLAAAGASTASASARAAALSRAYATLEPQTQRQITGAITLLNAAAPGGSLAALTSAQVTSFVSGVIRAGQNAVAPDPTFATAKDPSYVAFTNSTGGGTGAGSGVLSTLNGTAGALVSDVTALPGLVSELSSSQLLTMSTYALLELLDNPPVRRVADTIRGHLGTLDPPAFPTWSPTLLTAIVTWSAA